MLGAKAHGLTASERLKLTRCEKCKQIKNDLYHSRRYDGTDEWICSDCIDAIMDRKENEENDND